MATIEATSDVGYAKMSVEDIVDHYREELDGARPNPQTSDLKIVYTPLHGVGGETLARLFVSTSQNDSAEAYQGSLFSAQRVTSYADLTSGQELANRVIRDTDYLTLQAAIDAAQAKIDETNLPFLCDPRMRDGVVKRGDDPDALPATYVALLNDCLRDVPDDMVFEPGD